MIIHVWCMCMCVCVCVCVYVCLLCVMKTSSCVVISCVQSCFLGFAPNPLQRHVLREPGRSKNSFLLIGLWILSVSLLPCDERQRNYDVLWIQRPLTLTPDELSWNLPPQLQQQSLAEGNLTVDCTQPTIALQCNLLQNINVQLHLHDHLPGATLSSLLPDL